MKHIGILIFPEVEELDFVGPFEVLSFVNKVRPDSTRITLIAETTAPLQGSNGLTVVPETTITDCPPLDILVVPGGNGRRKAMKNPDILSFIRRQAETAEYMTSVCTGSILLAEAGLLKEKKATTYHEALEELASYGIEALSTKVVHDGRCITSGGVSSGLEMSFYLLSLLFSPELAQTVAEKIEYRVDVKNLDLYCRPASQ